MKARFLYFLITAFSTLTVLSGLTSCNDDKCKAIACAYGGVCTDGKCVCAEGFEGYQCETEMRARYMGIWTVTEDGTISDAVQYSVKVTPGSTPREIRISNFYNAFTGPVKAYVNSDTVTIPLQAVNRWKVQGRGQIKRDPYRGINGLITFTYQVQDTVQRLIDNYGYSGGEPSKWNK
jgi:hypothetical protein